jgi:hypothetical protein
MAAVVRLCQEAADKEAGRYASNSRPKNIEEAIDRMRWFQHNSQAIFGTTPGLTTGEKPGLAYCPETTLVSPLSETPTLGTPS